MKKKLFLSALAAAVLSSGMTVCAAPQYMDAANSEVFDPEWYLEQDPSLAEKWSLGTSAEALYEHYTRHGRSDGRKPHGDLDGVTILPYQGTDANAMETQPLAETATQPAEEQPTTQEQSADSNIIYAVEDETYRFPSIHSSRYNYADCMINISFYEMEYPEEESYFDDYLAAYTKPGYEWRGFSVSATTDSAVAPSSPDPYNSFLLHSKADFLWGRFVHSNDNATSDFVGLWEDIDENGWVTHVCTFTANQNGTQYPDCQIFKTSIGVLNDNAHFSWYALVPENFNGSLAAGYYGLKLENGEPVENEASPAVVFNF